MRKMGAGQYTDAQLDFRYQIMNSHSTEQIAPQPSHFPSSVAVVIPAWQPRSQLAALVHSLAETGCRAILVVDDGSSTVYQTVFQQLQTIPVVRVLRHSCNTGKGRALKTGLRHFLSEFAEYTGAVTADADGQHAIEDITRVAAVLAEQPQKLVLGARRRVAEMPFRSRIGNSLTRYVFCAATGVMLADTQTGLRGIPRNLVPELLAVEGERYEYEMAVLAHYCRSGRVPIEIPIRTIYTEQNSSSHFRPIRDSIHVYRVLAGCFLPFGSRLTANMPETPRAKG